MPSLWQVIVDSRKYADNLPHSVEAFFMLNEDSFIRQAHANFLSSYGLTSADVPLLLYSTRYGFTDVSQ